MNLRVSQIVVQLVLLDEFDAPQHAEPIIFAGDAEGGAPDKLAAWIEQLPEKLVSAKHPDSGSGFETVGAS